MLNVTMWLLIKELREAIARNEKITIDGLELNREQRVTLNKFFKVEELSDGRLVIKNLDDSDTTTLNK